MLWFVVMSFISRTFRNLRSVPFPIASLVAVLLLIFWYFWCCLLLFFLILSDQWIAVPVMCIVFENKRLLLKVQCAMQKTHHTTSSATCTQTYRRMHANVR